jgi:uncharacterized protein YbcC (UPF0753/DUF2309 family)
VSVSRRPDLQAAFCIDVRSEAFRRSLEAAAPGCETIGIAGFFGFPVEYVPLGEESGGARCPVLLSPKAVIAESVIGEDTRAASARRLARRFRDAWKSFKTSAVACFGFVGPVGLVYLPKLITDAAGATRTVPHPSRDGLPAGLELHPDLEPRLLSGRHVGLGLEDRIAMAEGLLRGMSLTRGFARLVLLVGHGSSSVNNPHAAGLDCGACGGHAGDANARLAAAALNETGVQAGLARKGIEVPEDTLFVGCLHDTTTDIVTMFDTGAVPPSHINELRAVREALAAAEAAGALYGRSGNGGPRPPNLRSQPGLVPGAARVGPRGLRRLRSRATTTDTRP